MSEEEKIRGLMPDFSAYMAHWTNKLTELYIEGPITKFWDALKFFVLALPNNIREEVWPEIEKIDLERNRRIQSIKGVDAYTILKKQYIEEVTFLRFHAVQVWGKVQQLLDLYGYKIKESHRLTKKAFEELKAEKE